MPFWSKYTDPPTFMICGINFFKMLTAFYDSPRIKGKYKFKILIFITDILSLVIFTQACKYIYGRFSTIFTLFINNRFMLNEIEAVLKIVFKIHKVT